jgi:RNA polymerase sigma factor (sigma-70 family)
VQGRRGRRRGRSGRHATTRSGPTGDDDAGATPAHDGQPAITPSTFVELHDRWVDPLRNYIARRVGHDLAEELTAQTFVEAWAGRDRFDPDKGLFSSWLFGIATNLVRRHVRSEERSLRLAARLAHEQHAASDEDQVLDRVVALRSWPTVAHALSGLPRSDRDVLFLFVYADLSYEEIAEALDVAVGTVRSRLARARARLTARLVAHEADGAER